MSHKCKRKRPRREKCRVTIPFSTLLRCEWEQYDRRALCIGGCILLAVALCCRLGVGSPIYARRLFCGPTHGPGAMPTMIVLYVVGGGLYVLLGALIGAMVSAPTPAILRARFRGTALLIPVALFRLCWYPLLFGALTPALALISLCIAAFCAAAACHSLRCVSRIAPLVLAAQLLWLLRLAVATGAWLIAN